MKVYHTLSTLLFDINLSNFVVGCWLNSRVTNCVVAILRTAARIPLFHCLAFPSVTATGSPLSTRMRRV